MPGDVLCGCAGVPVVSAPTQTSPEALVWAIDASSTLFAWDATTLQTLWTSLGITADYANCTKSSHVKFATPAVLDTVVYIGCSDQLIGYGLRATAAPVSELSGSGTPTRGPAGR